MLFPHSYGTVRFCDQLIEVCYMCNKLKFTTITMTWMHGQWWEPNLDRKSVSPTLQPWKWWKIPLISSLPTKKQEHRYPGPLKLVTVALVWKKLEGWWRVWSGIPDEHIQERLEVLGYLPILWGSLSQVPRAFFFQGFLTMFPLPLYTKTVSSFLALPWHS